MRTWLWTGIAIFMMACGGTQGDDAEFGDDTGPQATEEVGSVEQGVYYQWQQFCPAGTHRIAYCTLTNTGIVGCARTSDRQEVIANRTTCNGCVDLGDQLRCN
ncbi:hypothetical protein ACLEPN_21450 [Myxococcus sp. 1LA]